jgi:hypothetical protein
MLDKKPTVDIINKTERVIHLPFIVNEEIISIIRDVEGVTFSRPNPYGKYEVGYQVGKCFSKELVDRNVCFVVEQYIKTKDPKDPGNTIVI